MATANSDELNKLRAELDEVSRREAAFRLKTVKDFFAIEAKQRELQAKRDQRDVYVHELHLERDALRKALHEAHADIEAFTWMLRSHERDAAALKSLKSSFVWPLISGLTKKADAPKAEVPPGEFTYFFYTSPFRLYRGANYTLRGWALPNDGKAITGIQARIDSKTFVGHHGREEPEVVAHHGAQPNNPKPGFEVTVETPPGRHQLSVEAQIENSEWATILSIPIWCQPDGS